MISRGPPGVAPPPPAWLSTVRLPLHTVSADTTLYRVHRSALGAVFYGPGRGNPPTYRFDSLSSAFGVMYAGLSLSSALVETLLRNPNQRLVDYSQIAARSVTQLTCPTDLRFVQMYGAGLSQLGTDNSISTGPYEVCGHWADELWRHPDTPDGIAYRSRHDPAQLCLALFERPGRIIKVGQTLALTSRMSIVSRILCGHGKQIIGKVP